MLSGRKTKNEPRGRGKRVDGTEAIGFSEQREGGGEWSGEKKECGCESPRQRQATSVETKLEKSNEEVLQEYVVEIVSETYEWKGNRGAG